MAPQSIWILKNSLSKMVIFCRFTLSQAIQDVDEFVSSSEQILRNVVLCHLITSGSSAVEWVPSE